MTGVRGGDAKIKLFTRVLRALMTDRALKIALIAAFGTAGVTFFHDEIIALLADDTFNSVCVKDTDGDLKIMCDIIEEYELKSHTTQMKEIISVFSLTNMSGLPSLGGSPTPRGGVRISGPPLR